MRSYTGGERLAVLESQVDEIKNEVLELRTDVKALTSSVDTMVNKKVSEHVQINFDILQIKEQMKKLQIRSVLDKWIAGVLGAVASSILTYVVLNYLQHIK